ncbi:hypothetical protein [Lutibacter sp.]|uniref:hypothetical protein n=1 Tax=Lutibacter sp. TaxID=1925666 RepID=UPI0025BA22CB|nr:hypothetical protein [Lutibacter sp.]MCF6182594.1 hypothetical protein [Lutibacter sp.]
MKRSKNIIIISIAIIISILLVIYSGSDKGLEAFIAIPLLLFLNASLSIYGFLTKQKKIGIAGLILFFVAPIFAFIYFINVFQFLTR